MAVGGTLDLVLQARALAGARRWSACWRRFLRTPPGFVWIGRSGLSRLLWRVLSPSRASRAAPAGFGGCAPRWPLRRDDRRPREPRRRGAEARWLSLGGGASPWPWLRGWAGCLPSRPCSGAPGPTLRLPTPLGLALAIPAFSRIAVLAVGFLTVSGLFLARFHLASGASWWARSYGRWLLAKIVVFAAMLALGARHQGWVAPRLTRALARGETAPAVVLGFRRSVRLEAALGLVALGLAGALGVTAPPAPPSRSPGARRGPAFRHERTLDEARVRLEVTPLRPGPNAIRLTVTDPAGRPLADATAAIVQVTPVDASVGAVTFQLDRVAPGVFAAPSAALGLVGRWSGRLVVQRTNAYDVNDRFELVVAEGRPRAHAHRCRPPRPPPAARRSTASRPGRPWRSPP